VSHVQPTEYARPDVTFAETLTIATCASGGPTHAAAVARPQRAVLRWDVFAGARGIDGATGRVTSCAAEPRCQRPAGRC